MNQIIYNVTVGVTPEIRDQWLQYMREVQIPRVLKTGMFTSARLLRVHAFEKDALTYSVQYLAENRDCYEEYQKEFAANIDAEYRNAFGQNATNFATILEVLDSVILN
jgi:hypothetical protein